MLGPKNFVTQNSDNLLIPLVAPNTWDPILANDLKALIEFIGEAFKILPKKLQDVVVGVIMVLHLVSSSPRL